MEGLAGPQHPPPPHPAPDSVPCLRRPCLPLQTSEETFRHLQDIVDFGKNVMKEFLGENSVHCGVSGLGPRCHRAILSGSFSVLVWDFIVSDNCSAVQCRRDSLAPPPRSLLTRDPYSPPTPDVESLMRTL